MRPLRQAQGAASIRATPYSGCILSCVLSGVEACPEQRRRGCPEGVSKDEPSGAEGRNLVAWWNSYSGHGP